MKKLVFITLLGVSGALSCTNSSSKLNKEITNAPPINNIESDTLSVWKAVLFTEQINSDLDISKARFKFLETNDIRAFKIQYPPGTKHPPINNSDSARLFGYAWKVIDPGNVSILTGYLNKFLKTPVASHDHFDNIRTAIILYEKNNQDTLWINKNGTFCIKNRYFYDDEFSQFLDSLLPKGAGHYE